MDSTSTNPVRRRPVRSAVYEEHTASDGTSTTGVLKLVGILCLLGSIILAVIMISSASDPLYRPIQGPVMLVAVFSFMQGVTLCALFFAIALIVENLAAIRKNSSHLAGIRGNADMQTQMMQQENGYERVGNL